MHVGSMLHFTYPAGEKRGYLSRLLADLRAAPIEPPWYLRLQTRMLMRQPVHRWVEDEAFDIDYHVRHSALPAPAASASSASSSPACTPTRSTSAARRGRCTSSRALGRAVRRLHQDPPLPRRRVHRDPHAPAGAVERPRRPGAPVLLQRPQAAPAEGAPREADPVGDVASILRGLASSAGATPVGAQGARRDPAAARAHADQGRHEHQAPDSILNSRTGRSRRFATQEYDLARLRAIAKARNATLNDVLMAICAGGLRTLARRPGRPARASPRRVHPRQRARPRRARAAATPSAPPWCRWPPTSRTRSPGWPRSRRRHGRRRRGCGG